ncbi:uncharacterized protein PHACADRAFT_206137 [Phanerochaete carnosa HHB-10118-sp]|uniref:Uncharacterized protein n=1 Tax=Phanerochaete carnosa (strain HHB-10118-sp) TaxID=650164 RepID=K5W7K3_PHACS|nr:uncharacterized protein PHACADRAFT_206137 [Phanerochaete carnosa HHB-10118-sp]EKM59918.1 hypothetical protein PHACADRAFT_206137 [Phanerochaete carnosa HHB-10118-sp]
MLNNGLIHAAAGAAGGIVAVTATYPLVVLSTRESVDKQDQTKAKKSILEALQTIRREKGWTALYRGVGPCLFAIALTNGFYYFFYENTKEFIVKSREGSKALSTLESMLAGLVAGSCTAILSNPVWVIQTTQINQDTSDKPKSRMGVIQTVRTLLKDYGISAFFRGVGPALVLVMNPIIQYTVFEQMKNLLIKRRTAKLRATGGLAIAVAVLSDWDYFFLGALSKLVATSLTYPYIVVKNRLQAGSDEAARYKSALHSVLIIAKEEGIEGLYRGLSSKLLQSVLTAAILFASQKRIYEFTKQALAVAPVFAK